jgi:hypothetical protein
MKKFLPLLMIIFLSGCRTFSSADLQLHDMRVYDIGYQDGKQLGYKIGYHVDKIDAIAESINKIDDDLTVKPIQGR